MSKLLKMHSPLNGTVAALDSVPDPVFSEKVLGDGCAVIPTDGKIYSPVDGEISSIAETNHAYGFTSDDGLEILVHFGLETVALKGEGFKPLVAVGDKVKKGDLVAEVDLALLKEKGINLITPVLVCDGADDLEMHVTSGTVKAGDVLLSFGEAAEETAQPEAPASEPEKPAPKQKKGFNFDFLQKLGKVLMTVIAVMPAAGLMISLGKLVGMAGADISAVVTIGSVMENIGWAVISNLHILFAAAIGGSWAKEKAGGAFAAIIAFILCHFRRNEFHAVRSECGGAFLIRTGNAGRELLHVRPRCPGTEYGCIHRHYFRLRRRYGIQ